MATGTLSQSSKVNRKLLFDSTRQAVDAWFTDSGMVEKRREIDLDRTFKSYGMNTPHLDELSEYVIGAVEQKIGFGLELTPVRFRKFKAGTVGTYINDSVILFLTALPGKPSTMPSKPVTLPGEPVALPGKPSSVPGKPSTMPSKPATLVGKLRTLPGQPKKAPKRARKAIAKSALPGKPTTLPSKPSSKR